MKTPKKLTKKSPLVDSDAEMEDSTEGTTSKKFKDDDDDYDAPLDDLDTFDNYGSIDDDDDY